MVRAKVRSGPMARFFAAARYYISESPEARNMAKYTSGEMIFNEEGILIAPEALHSQKNAGTILVPFDESVLSNQRVVSDKVEEQSELAEQVGNAAVTGFVYQGRNKYRILASRHICQCSGQDVYGIDGQLLYEAAVFKNAT